MSRRLTEEFDKDDVIQLMKRDRDIEKRIKEATKEIDLCDIAYSNINSIEFKKPFYAKEIRIQSEDVFDIEKLYFYTYKDNVVMITSRINDNDICWYINSNSYNNNTEIEGIDCIEQYQFTITMSYSFIII